MHASRIRNKERDRLLNSRRSLGKEFTDIITEPVPYSHVSTMAQASSSSEGSIANICSTNISNSQSIAPILTGTKLLQDKQIDDRDDSVQSNVNSNVNVNVNSNANNYDYAFDYATNVLNVNTVNATVVQSSSPTPMMLEYACITYT